MTTAPRSCACSTPAACSPPDRSRGGSSGARRSRVGEVLGVADVGPVAARRAGRGELVGTPTGQRDDRDAKSATATRWLFAHSRHCTSLRVQNNPVESRPDRSSTVLDCRSRSSRSEPSDQWTTPKKRFTPDLIGMSRISRRARWWSNTARSLRKSYPRTPAASSDGISSPAATYVAAQPSIDVRFTFSRPLRDRSSGRNARTRPIRPAPGAGGCHGAPPAAARRHPARRELHE